MAIVRPVSAWLGGIGAGVRFAAVIADIVSWSPFVQALAVVAVVALLPVVTHSDERMRRLVDLIRAFRSKRR